jgi:hypothetical protein
MPVTVRTQLGPHGHITGTVTTTTAPGPSDLRLEGLNTHTAARPRHETPAPTPIHHSEAHGQPSQPRPLRLPLRSQWVLLILPWNLFFLNERSSPEIFSSHHFIPFLSPGRLGQWVLFILPVILRKDGLIPSSFAVQITWIDLRRCSADWYDIFWDSARLPKERLIPRIIQGSISLSMFRLSVFLDFSVLKYTAIPSFLCIFLHPSPESIRWFWWWELECVPSAMSRSKLICTVDDWN